LAWEYHLTIESSSWGAMPKVNGGNDDQHGEDEAAGDDALDLN
jgi:hypothetical protein